MRNTLLFWILGAILLVSVSAHRPPHRRSGYSHSHKKPKACRPKSFKFPLSYPMGYPTSSSTYTTKVVTTQTTSTSSCPTTKQVPTMPETPCPTTSETPSPTTSETPCPTTSQRPPSLAISVTSWPIQSSAASDLTFHSWIRSHGGSVEYSSS